MMAERIGVTRQTYRRVEQGDPTVAIGTFLMAIFVLGLDAEGLERITDPHSDTAGAALEIAELPRKVTPRRTPGAK
jgi:transcriptional regulator with XRE-family HTH domain